MDNYVITISRQFASLGRSVAQKISENLGIEFYDRDIVEATSKRMAQPISIISNEEEIVHSKFFKRKYPLGMGVSNIQDEIFSIESSIISDIAKKESCIIVGRCANSVLKDHKRILNVYVYASREDRMKNCVDVLKMEATVAKKMLKEIDKARDNYRMRYCKDVKTPYDGYDIMIDSSKLGVDKTAQVLTEIAKGMFS